MKINSLWKRFLGMSMSNHIYRTFQGEDIIWAMNLFHHSLVVENPILGNEVAQFIFRVVDQEVSKEERDILEHLMDELIKADEVRFKEKRCPLAQEYEYLISKRIH